MKLKRLTQTISLMLALVLTLQLASPALLGDWGITAQAATGATASGYNYTLTKQTSNTVTATTTEAFVDETGTIEHPTPTLTSDGARYISILQTYSSYSKLPAGAATFIVNYTGISASDFQTMTQKGKNLTTAIKIGTLAKAAQCSVSSILSLNLTDAEYQKRATQMALYNASISADIDTTTDTKLRGLILQGNSCEQVFNAYGASKVLSTDMTTLLGNGNQTLANALVNNAEQIKNQKAHIMAAPQGNVTGTGLTAGESVFSDRISSPYTYNFNDSEKVSLNSGALILNNTDYVLPGVNGLEYDYIGTQHKERVSVY